MSDADEICNHSRAVARHNLLTDATAIEDGVDGIDLGTAALRQYVSRLFVVTQRVGYC